MSKSYVATCRFCGAQGIEDEADPAPGICPKCFEQRLAEATKKVTPDTTEQECVSLLLEVGVTPQHAGLYVGLMLMDACIARLEPIEDTGGDGE